MRGHCWQDASAVLQLVLREIALARQVDVPPRHGRMERPFSGVRPAFPEFWGFRQANIPWCFGFRARKTNEMLRRAWSGVSVDSLQQHAKAADISLAGSVLLAPAATAWRTEPGGVDIQSGFVHAGTARRRHRTG